MDADSSIQWPNPKRLKTLAFNATAFEDNNLLHRFVLNNSHPNRTGSEQYINAVLLSMAQCSVNAVNAEGYTALHLAVLKNNLLMVKKLLSCLGNIDVNRRGNDCSRSTALHFAAVLGHLSIVQLLIEKGADLNAANKKGRTPLHISTTNGHLKLAEMLIEKGAHLNAADREGRTPLHWASGRGYFEIAKLLIEKGAHLNAADKEGRTPLHISTTNGHLKLAELLIEKGADLKVSDVLGEIPLHVATNKGHLKLVELLIEKELT